MHGAPAHSAPSARPGATVSNAILLVIVLAAPLTIMPVANSTCRVRFLSCARSASVYDEAAACDDAAPPAVRNMTG